MTGGVLRRVGVLGLAAAVVTAAACGAKAQAVLPDAAPLAMPGAPARAIVPAPPDPVPAPATETVAAPPATATPPAGAGRANRDTPPVRQAPPPVTPPSTPPPAAPPTAPTPIEATANATELEQRARALKDAAEKALDRLDYKTLGADARAQYDTARRFLKQADDALKVKNVVYAWQLADKANTIATLLR